MAGEFGKEILWVADFHPKIAEQLFGVDECLIFVLDLFEKKKRKVVFSWSINGYDCRTNWSIRTTYSFVGNNYYKRRSELLLSAWEKLVQRNTAFCLRFIETTSLYFVTVQFYMLRLQFKTNKLIYQLKYVTGAT